MLKVNRILTHLDLHENQQGGLGAKPIVQALLVNLSLKKLDVSFNRLGKLLCQAFLEALVHNDTLTSTLVSEYWSKRV